MTITPTSFIFGLPAMPTAKFISQATTTLNGTAPQFVVDNGEKLSPLLPAERASRLFGPSSLDEATLAANYRAVAEAHRQKEVARELALTIPHTLQINLDDWFQQAEELRGVTKAERANYRKGLKTLLRVAPLIDAIYLHQIGVDETIKRALENEALTDNDRELMRRQRHPWGESDPKNPFAVALPSLPPRQNGVVSNGITKEELGTDLMGAANPFSLVTRNESGILTTTHYHDAYAHQLSQIIPLLLEAAQHFERIDREQNLASYLRALAEAFENKSAFPYEDSDKAWADFMNSDSLLYLRIGPDEVGKGKGSIGDTFATKARFQFRLGVKNLTTGALLEQYASHADDFEAELAALAPSDTYQARKIETKAPQLFDIIAESGDASRGGAGGLSVGQTLPNWGGTDGRSSEYPQATMIWLNKLLAGYSGKALSQINEKLLYPLLSPRVRELLAQGSPEYVLAKVAAHETAHMHGPQMTTAPIGSDQSRMQLLGGGAMALLIEELKADTGMGFLGFELFEKGEVDEPWIQTFVASQLAWCLDWIATALNAGDGTYNGNVYSHIAALQFGMLSEAGLFVFDESNGYWDINFQNAKAAFATALRTTLSIYAPGDRLALENLLHTYTQGDGTKLLHFDRIIETGLHRKPKTSLSYELVGLSSV